MTDDERRRSTQTARREPVVAEVVGGPESLNAASEKESHSAAALDAPAIAPPTRVGALEEAPALDPQSEPDGDKAAIPSQARMLMRHQSRRAAKAGTTLAAEVTADDPRSYSEALNGPLQRQWRIALQIAKGVRVSVWETTPSPRWILPAASLLAANGYTRRRGTPTAL